MSHMAYYVMDANGPLDSDMKSAFLESSTPLASSSLLG